MAKILLPNQKSIPFIPNRRHRALAISERLSLLHQSGCFSWQRFVNLANVTLLFLTFAATAEGNVRRIRASAGLGCRGGRQAAGAQRPAFAERRGITDR